MVVIQIKKGDSDGFLFEAPSSTSNETVVTEIVRINNMRARLQQLVGGIREMAKYGPMKPPDKAGLDNVEEEYNGAVIDKNEFYQCDPTGARIGSGPGPQLADTIERVAIDTESCLDKNLIARKVSLTLEMLQEKLDTIRGVVIMAYPMGLPEWDSVRLTIEGEGGLDGTSAGMELMEEDTTELWVATRCLDRSQTLADRFGKNEKTKVIGKLQKLGGGAPAREAAVSEDEKKAMMAFYFKKQEEMKQMADNTEDDYLNSSWADSKQMQRSLRGQGSVKAPGIH